MTDDNVTNIKGPTKDNSTKKLADEIIEILLKTLERDLKDMLARVQCIEKARTGNIKGAMEVAIKSMIEREKNKEKDNESQ